MKLKQNEIAVRNNLGEIIVVKITHKGEKGADWGKGYDWDTASQHHRVFVRNVATGKKTSFDYWASRAKPNAEDGKAHSVRYIASLPTQTPHKKATSIGSAVVLATTKTASPP